MDNKPLVSAVIIFLNEERFLEEAIKSVLEQSYDNWELMLVDDGSTDRSTEIAIHYAKQYPGKVRYLEHDGHQNRGSSAARNLGIKNAKGEYIAFLDADDVWLSYKLEQQVPVLETHNEAAMLYGKSFFWYSWTGEPDDIQNDYESEVTILPTVRPYKPLKREEFLPLFVQRKVLIPPTTSLFVRRKTIERLGGFEESFRGLFDDQVFIVKISLEAPIILVPKVFEKYRQHPDSCCSIATSSERYKVRLTYLNWLEEYMSALEIKDANLWKTLRKVLFEYRHPVLWPFIYHSKRLVVLMEGRVKNVVKKIIPGL